MKAREYADRIGVAHGTVKRWLSEGMPAKRGGRARLVIDPAAADAWVDAHRAKSVAFARSSLVYLVARASDDAIKIGWTSDLERRLPELRKETRDNIRLLAAFVGAKPDELRLQARFETDRIEGEWFHPSAALRRFVDSLRSAA